MGWVSITSTRLAGALSVVALILITISDFTFTEFWDENAMMTSIVADVLVLIVGVAVVNEFLAARSRSRWRLVAEYGLVELARSCRRVWIGLAELIGVGSRVEATRDELRDAVRGHSESGQLQRLAEEAVAAPDRRRELRELVSSLVFDARAALTSWASVLVESAHSDQLARFAEMQALLARLDLVLTMEAEGKRPSIGETTDSVWVAQRVVTILEAGADLAPALFSSAEQIMEREREELSAVRAREEDGPGASAGAG